MPDNKMGTTPIPKLLFSMALPAIISMFVQALYNIVDSIFVAKIGEGALTAVSLAFPLQMLIVSCFVGMGVGINSGIARKLGAGHQRDAESVSEHGFVVALLISVVLGVLGVVFSRHFAVLFTDDPEIIEHCSIYLKIVMGFCFGSIITQAGFSTLQGSGEMVQPMIGQLVGAVTNIILDPIMIFGLLGFPALGVAGAAIATVTGQIIAMVYVLIVVFKGKNFLKPHFSKFKLQGRILKEIALVGLPAAVMQGIGSVMVTGYNLILASYGMTAVAVFGVYFKMQSFIFMPVFGLGQGLMPILGYNFGARNPSRFKEGVKVGVASAVVIMLVGTVLFQLFPAQIFALFDASPQMAALGARCFRAISLAFPLAGASIMLSTTFQATGRAYLSLIASILRQLVFLLPVSYLFSLWGGLDYVWYGFPVSELACLLLSGFFLIRLNRDVINTWRGDEPLGLENHH